MSEFVNNQYDFFKLVNVDANGNVGVNVISGGSGGNNFVTGGTYNGGTTSLDFVGNAGFNPFSVNVSALLDDTNTYTTGATLNGNTIEFNRNDLSNAYSVDLSSLKFTGNTLGTCITDLYVTNLYGCSPITVKTSLQSNNSTASGYNSFAFGEQTTASGYYSHAEGYLTIASGFASHAEGQETTASGYNSHAEGASTTASGYYSHAEGFETTASGTYSHAEGYQTLASSNFSHSEGRNTTASGDNSHAGGNNSTVSGVGSFIHSTNSLLTGDRSVLLGGQNLTGTTNDTVYVPNLNVNGDSIGLPYDISFAVSDETSEITTGSTKISLYASRDFVITGVKASLSTTGSTISEFDILINDASILSTNITIDANEFTSTTAATPPVVSSSNITDNDKITIDILQAGTGATGAKIYIIGKTL